MPPLTAPGVLDGIRQVVRTRLRLEQPIDPQTDLVRDLQLSSLSQLTLVVELEDHFHVCFEEGDEQQVQTVQDLVRLIVCRISQQEAARGAGDTRSA